jgi:hypothetical protein
MLARHELQKGPVATWVETNQGVLGLILPEVPLARWLKDGDYAQRENDLLALASAGETGKALCLAPLISCLCLTVQGKMDKLIDAWLAKADAKLSCETFSTLRSEAMKEVREINGLELIPLRREVELRYRSKTVRLTVSNLTEELEVRAFASIKARAVDQQLLKPFPLEPEIIGKVAATQQSPRSTPRWCATRAWPARR